MWALGEAGEFLRRLGVGGAAITSHLTAAAHKRLHREVTERIAAFISAHTQGTTTDEELDAALSSLGIDDRARAHHLTVARIPRGSKVFTSAQSKHPAPGNPGRQ